MCGIFACLTSDSEDVRSAVFEGLYNLQNRGFDSCGVALSLRDNLPPLILKRASRETTHDSLMEVQKSAQDYKGVVPCAIGHCRWATNGEINDMNAHPHSHGTKIIVHNGIVENSSDIFTSNDYTPVSQTDSEAIALTWSKSESLYSATEQLQGTWAVVGMDILDPEALYVTKNGSPLIVGWGEHTMVVCSEVAALPHGMVERYYPLRDGECFRISAVKNDKAIAKFCFQDIQTGKELSLQPKQLHPTDHRKLEHTSWTEQEIYEQPAVLSLHENETPKHGIPKNTRHLVLLGCGTSWHASLVGAIFARESGKFVTVSTFEASEFSLSDLPRDQGVVAVILSQSGETKDCQRALNLIREKCYCIAVVNVPTSWLARESHNAVYVRAGREVGVASTKSFTAQVSTVVDMISSCSKSTDWSSVFSSALPYIHSQAQRLVPLMMVGGTFILGRGYGWPIALEGALKLKELTYRHVDGFASGMMKHGPLSLIDRTSLVFILAFSGPNRQKMIHALHEVHSRKARVVVITDSDLGDNIRSTCGVDVIEIPNTGSELLSAMLANTLFQFLAVEAATHLGYHCDFPRNLAKCVTVDG